MAKRNSAIADLDIAAEGKAQQDGLAERLARRRVTRDAPDRTGAEAMTTAVPASEPESEPAKSRRSGARDANAWRKGKALLQVAISEESHVELSIIAKRRRMTLSQLVKSAVDQWLETHGHSLRVG
jgi:hypothetical protein